MKVGRPKLMRKHAAVLIDVEATVKTMRNHVLQEGRLPVGD